MLSVKRLSIISLSAVFFIVALVIAPYFQEKKPITLGFIGGLSGKAADLGVECRRGAEIAVSRINKNGGINGRTVELVALDDEHDPEQAKIAIKKLLEMNLQVIIGHTTSGMTMATLPLVNDSDTILLSPTSSSVHLRDLDDNFIRSCAVSTDVAVRMAKYLRKDPKVIKVGVVYDLGNKAYTKQWYEAFEQAFLADRGTVVQSFTFTSGPDTKLLPLVQEIQKHEFDTLVIVSNSVDAAMVSQHVRKIGWKVPLAFADWAATEQLVNLGGDSVEGAIFSQYFDRNNSKPDYLSFKKEFIETYKTEPGFGAMHGYNATMIALDSLQRQKKGESLKETILNKSQFKGLQSDITINKFGDSDHPTHIGRIHGGKFNVIVGQ